MIEVEGGSRAAALKGSMTYAFTHMRNFLLLLLEAGGMAKFGRNWKNLAEFGKIWQNLADIGRIWQNLVEGVDGRRRRRRRRRRKSPICVKA